MAKRVPDIVGTNNSAQDDAVAEQEKPEALFRNGRRVPIEDDVLLTLGEIAVLAASLEFFVHEMCVLLISPHEFNIGDVAVRSMSFEGMHSTVEQLIPTRLDEGGLATLLWRGNGPSLLVAMRQRNEVLHAARRWGWHPERPIVGPPVVRHRRTGSSREGAVTDLSSLEGVADELRSCEVAARQIVFGTASELGVADAFEERYIYWMPASIERRSADRGRGSDI